MAMVDNEINRTRREMPITEERVERTVNSLSYAEIASVRNNLSLYEQAHNYQMNEKKSLRLTITTKNELTDQAVETKLSSVLDMFSVGSHT